MYFYFLRAVVNISIQTLFFIFAMTLMSQDDHLTARAWAASSHNNHSRALGLNQRALDFCFDKFEALHELGNLLL